MDEETGLYYYGARYYDPGLSLWLSVDPLAEKYPNKTSYHFCSNNPVSRIDPSGNDDHYFNEKGVKICQVPNKIDRNYVIKTIKTTDVIYGNTNSVQGGMSYPITPEAADLTEREIRAGNLTGEHMENVIQIQNNDNMQAMLSTIKDNGEGGVSSLNNKEYSGYFGTNGVYGIKESEVGKPSAGMPLVSIGNNDFHSHPSGTEKIRIRGKLYIGLWQQPPSKQDISVSGNKNKYVVGMGDGTIYIYNKKGVIATIPITTFK